MRTHHWLLSFALVAGSLIAGTAGAQTPSAATVNAAVAEAAAAYDARDWAKAAQLYERLTVTAPAPRAWYRLGVVRRNLGQYDSALAAFDSGIGAGLPLYQAEVGKATVYAVRKDADRAFEFLQKAVEHGFSAAAQLSGDEALAGLAGDPRFARVVEQANRNLKVCAHRPENRQFDFWLGEWRAVTTQGETPAGDSRIELILDDCVVLENWQSIGSPYAGKSYNTWDAANKRWEQFWVDNVGGKVLFYGGLKDGVMDYMTDDLPQPDGSKVRRHLQFFKLGPDRVRQFSQRSSDAGKTWTVEYDFTYLRKK